MGDQLQSLQTEMALGRSDQRLLWDSHASLSSTSAQQGEQLRDILAFFHGERLKKGAGQSSPDATTAKDDPRIQVPAHRKEAQRSAADATASISSFKRSLGFWMERLSEYPPQSGEQGLEEQALQDHAEADGDCTLPEIGSELTCTDQQQQRRQQRRQQQQQTQCAQQGHLLEQSALHWPLCMASGEKVQRLGRFTVFAPTNDIAPPPAASTALHRSPLHAEAAEQLSGVNLEEVHTALASTNCEFGALLGKTRAQLLDLTVTHGLPREHAANSCNGNSGFNLSDSTSVASSQHPSVSAASLGVYSNHLVGADEVLNQWETLGKPIEHTTKRNRALEEENKRLKKEVALKTQELQELQHRAQTQTQAQAVSIYGDASTGSSTPASTPTHRSSGSAPAMATISATSALLGNSRPSAPI